MNDTSVASGAVTRRRRADAERSIEAILDAAADQIVSEADVNMSAVARTAGVSRVTLYTHFPTRELLLEALLARAIELTGAAMDAATAGDGSAREVLDRLLRSSWQLLARHRNLHTVVTATFPPAQLRRQHQPVLGRLEELLVRGQAEGDFRTDLPADWLIATMYTLLHLAAEEVTAGRLDTDRAGELAAATVLSVLTDRAGGR